MPITIKKNVMAYKNPSDGTYTGIDAVNDATLEERIGAVESELEDKYEKPANGIPATDIASGVIPDVSGKTDQGAVATPYGSLTWPVTAGQYCFQNGYVYKAKQDIATSESWTAAHWDQVVLSDEVCRAMNAIQGLEEVTQIYYDDIESGTIDGTTGANADQIKRCRTAGYIDIDDFWYCNLAGTNYKLNVFLYTSNKTYIQRISTDFWNINLNREYVNKTLYPTAEYMRICFSLASNADMTQTDVENLKKYVCVSELTTSLTAREIQREADTIESNVITLDKSYLSTKYLSIETGSLSGSDGSTSSGGSRCRTADYINIDDFICCDITGESGYKMYLFLYNSSKTFISRVPLNWINACYTQTGIKTNYPDAKYIKLLFARSNDATITDTDKYKMRSTIFMRSADSRTEKERARFDGQFNYIAYSELAQSLNDAPQNTLPHFLKCANSTGNKFTSLKGDVRPTSDGGLIMCHNTGFTLDGNGKIIAFNSSSQTKIDTLTVAQCKALTYADQYNGVDVHPTDFETYVRICKKYGLMAFVTVRDEQISTVVAPVVLATLKKYRMLDRAIINSFTKSTLETFRALNNSITLSLVLDNNAAPTTETVDYVVSLGSCNINLFDVPLPSGSTLETVLSSYSSVIEYGLGKGVVFYEAQTGNALIDTMMSYGIMGSQMYDFPDYDYGL